MNNFCPHCGTQLDDNQSFCPNCGTPFTPPAFQQPNYTPHQPANNNNTILIVLVAVLATLLVAGFAGYYFFKEKPTPATVVASAPKTKTEATVKPVEQYKVQRHSKHIDEGYHTFIGHCNIREYPTSNSYIVGTAEDGWSCYVSGYHEGSWYWVVLNNGTQGWTHKQNLR